MDSVERSNTHGGKKKWREEVECGGGMDESYRKLLHANARCAAVTPSRPVTMRSFVPEMGINKNTYARAHTHFVRRFLVGQWRC